MQLANYFGSSPIFFSEGKTIQSEKMEFKQTPNQLAKQSLAILKLVANKKPNANDV